MQRIRGNAKRYADGFGDYMTGDTKLLPYLPYPRFLLGADLTQTAKLLYAVLLDRANLSRANGWTDESGNIFIVFPLNKLSDMVDKGPTTVKTALTELEAAALWKRDAQSHLCETARQPGY